MSPPEAVSSCSTELVHLGLLRPPLDQPRRQPTNAATGSRQISSCSPPRREYLVVVFDAPGRTFRDEIYASYKANRPATPDDLAAQVPLVHRVVAGFRLPVLTVPAVEADDVIATLATRFAAEGVECVIVRRQGPDAAGRAAREDLGHDARSPLR